MSRRLITAAASGALLLGLAACGEGSDAPVTTPPPEIAAGAASDGGGDAGPSDGGGAESDESSVAAPDIPPPDRADYAGMDENTPEGAEQAFRYYIAASMWAHQTGDTTLLEEHQASNCESCITLNEDVPTLREHGQYWSSFDITDVGTQIHSSDTFDHEIGYYFIIGQHSRPNEDFSGRVDVDDLEYITVGGMDWLEGRWLVGGINAEWGDDVHE